MTATLPTELPARVLLLGFGELGEEPGIALRRCGVTVIACDSCPNASAMQVADSARVCDMRGPQTSRDVLDDIDINPIVPGVEAIVTETLIAAEERGRTRGHMGALAAPAA